MEREKTRPPIVESNNIKKKVYKDLLGFVGRTRKPRPWLIPFILLPLICQRSILAARLTRLQLDYYMSTHLNVSCPGCVILSVWLMFFVMIKIMGWIRLSNSPDNPTCLTPIFEIICNQTDSLVNKWAIIFNLKN